MYFNSGTDSIVAEIDDLCDSDSSSYTLDSKTRRVNIGLDEVFQSVIQADGTWEFDDTTNTDLPIGDGDLVDGQQDYSFASELLIVERIEVKDADGKYHKLKPLDKTNVKVALSELAPVNGLPTHYDKSGNSIFLYPIPAAGSVTLTKGLAVFFKRNLNKFESTDTDTPPGFATPYHVILAYMAAIPYCMTYKKDRVASYQEKVRELKLEIEKFYGRRAKDEVVRMTPGFQDNR